MGDDELTRHVKILDMLDIVDPLAGDQKIPFNTVDIQVEIHALEDEMNSISLDSVPFEASDFVVAFLAGLAGGCCDILIGKPADGYDGFLSKAKEPTIKKDSYFGLGKYLKKYDLINNPIDKTIPGASLGEHRLFSDGHDLFRFFDTLKVMMTGTGRIGVTAMGGEYTLDQAPERWLDALREIGVSPGDPKAYLKLSIVLALHLYKDFCSARSLPMPGSSFIAQLNGDKMPKFLDELTSKKEFNLRTMTGQALSVLSVEVIISLYSFIGEKLDEGQSYSLELYKEKKNRLLLLSHAIALLFNTGKVVVTKNPALINTPQIIRVASLGLSACKADIKRRQASIVKLNLAQTKQQLEVVDTLIFLDRSLYYTSSLDDLFSKNIIQFNNINKKRTDERNESSSEITALLDEWRDSNEG